MHTEPGQISLRFRFSPLTISTRHSTQKMKFSIEDFFSKCDQIRRKLRIWSHLLKKSPMENFSFCAVTLHFRYLAEFWIPLSAAAGHWKDSSPDLTWSYLTNALFTRYWSKSTILDFAVSTDIWSPVDTFRRWCKLNFGSIRDQEKSRHFAERIDTRRQYFHFLCNFFWKN